MIDWIFFCIFVILTCGVILPIRKRHQFWRNITILGHIWQYCQGGWNPFLPFRHCHKQFIFVNLQTQRQVIFNDELFGLYGTSSVVFRWKIVVQLFPSVDSFKRPSLFCKRVVIGVVVVKIFPVRLVVTVEIDVVVGITQAQGGEERHEAEHVWGTTCKDFLKLQAAGQE